ncbi:hypothetical protein D3C74_368930 [compost metagenome]
MGEKGFRLLEKLQSLETVYGILADSGEAFPLLMVEPSGSKLLLTSTYMHRVLTAILAIHYDWEKRKPFFYTGLVHARLIAARNTTAALMVIELVRLIVNAGSRRSPSVAVSRLEKYVPQLREIRLSSCSTSQKNRDLKRIFRAVYRRLQSDTDIFSTYRDLAIEEVFPTVNEFQLVIKANHKGYANKE